MEKKTITKFELYVMMRKTCDIHGVSDRDCLGKLANEPMTSITYIKTDMIYDYVKNVIEKCFTATAKRIVKKNNLMIEKSIIRILTDQL